MRRWCNTCRWGRGKTWSAGLLRIGFLLAGMTSVKAACAVTPDSPEVNVLVGSALAVLEKPFDANDGNATRLGGRCLVGLAFLKAKRPNHTRVAEAAEACRLAMTAGQPIDVYSNGLAIIFLSELAPKRYDREIRWYLQLLESRQMTHGGWGYDGNNADHYTAETGDTSQTQYAMLGYWQAFRHGFAINGASLEGAAGWLLRTQDPEGAWGYQGTLAPNSQRVSQLNISCSMLAAGLGSVLICADLFDAVPPPQHNKDDVFGESVTALPDVLRRSGTEELGSVRQKIQAQRIDAANLLAAVDLADSWMKKNYKVDIGQYTYYYLYATERYQSFRELLKGEFEEEPGWYNDGVDFLRTARTEEGGWRGGCGLAADTSFAVLFLLRSTQKTIRGTLGEGMLVGGRGIPANVATARLRGGQVVAEHVHSQVDELLAMIDDSDEGRLDELARDPSDLVVGNVDVGTARRLKQLVRGGEPKARLLAVRALARAGKLDYAPSLIFALTDPDRRIVLEARDGLQFLSRRFDGFGPPDPFTEKQRYEAVDAWKQWYVSLRPGASLEP